MLLSKLEIKGFKSFGDKVKLSFDKGITAVVGPNGSGKSNVVDAIRWVLGEQSTKALRSEKMENIIFNGTSKRKPLQMAEVSLTFLNNRDLLPTEYTEVTIARRYYRSGEGEYLLNGVPCRLKDIQGLFLDTGIGSDSYAIIELKMVDEILNDTNNSRRALFEEAAGISKFKKRKKETLKKLQETDADLERVEDLLHEIGKNMRSLERQAKEAQRYLKFKNEYRQQSISLARKSVTSQLDEMQRLNDELQMENTQQGSITKQIEEMEHQLETEKDALIQREKLLGSRQKTLNEHIFKIRQLESDKKIKGEKKKYLEDKKNTLLLQAEEDRQSNEQMKQSLNGLKTQLASAQKMLSETEFLLDDYETKKTSQQEKTETLKAQFSDLDSRIKTKEAALYQLKKSVEISEVQLSALKQELEREYSANTEKSASLEQFDRQFAALQAEQNEVKSELSYTQEQQVQHESKIAKTQAEIEQQKDRLAEINRSLDAKQHEYDLTKSMVENLEGYPDAIKYLKKNTDFAQNAPLLTDIITCDEEYRLAIEGYLEPYLNYFILQNEEEAWKAVNLLAEASKGKANFLLLDKFKGLPLAPRKAIQDAVHVLDVVEFDEKYKDLVNFMLHNAYIIVRNQGQLPQHDDVVLLTKNGKGIRKWNTVTGGSVGVFEGKKMGRAQNLKILQEDIQSLKTEKDTLELSKLNSIDELNALKEISYKADLDKLQQDMNLVSQEIVKIQTQKEEFSKFLAESENKRDEIMERIANAEQTIEENRPKAEEEQEGLEILKEQFDIINDDYQLENEKLTQLSAQFNQQNILFHQQQNQVESLDNEISFKESTYIKGEARVQSNLEEATRVDSELEEVANMDVAGDQMMEQLYEEKTSIEEGVQEAETSYHQARNKINELEKTVREWQHRKDNAGQRKLELNEKLNQIKLSLTSIKEKMAVEFELDLEEIASEENPEDSYKDMSESELKESVKTIKQKLDKIGPINHTAIDAYNEIKERNDFIIEQKKDLEKAKETLAQTIEEIDAVAKENFMEAFNNIRDNFMEVFRSLFTEEDKCDLRLVDPDDPLNSKISIMAQPKGKRPLTINQLSGGEKTLTATALLFAIYLIKPAPFCIFDEVDAPLDDANVGKFTKIIQKFSERSQFIIVTHNKRTMASTDVIYGVTMIEQGVTTVVPVDIRNTPQLEGFVH
ncbi:chromosome segregation protein SMC [Limibacter armeniacum]|uniref:chromosome segregation protein SMC n=1 Tax=Limibacter armeniacum TaxID=466084 RepID=UPI002FE51470